MEVTQEKQDDKTVKIDITRTNVEDSISIVIVNKDKPEYLNICLQSIAVIPATITMKLLLLIMQVVQKHKLFV